MEDFLQHRQNQDKHFSKIRKTKKEPGTKKTTKNVEASTLNQTEEQER